MERKRGMGKATQRIFGILVDIFTGDTSVWTGF